MPTVPAPQAKSPEEKRLPSEAVAFGKQQWTRKWKTFARQWSQPKLMKLAKETLGEAALHSSQIHGFTTGTLRDPAPKVIFAIGQLNLAIAKANNGKIRGELPRWHPRCPGTLSDLWLGKHWLKDVEGFALGPVGVFEVISGIINVFPDDFDLIRAGGVEQMSSLIGKFMRLRLGELGKDWYSSKTGDFFIDTLLFGGTVDDSTLLIDRIGHICLMCRCTEDELIDTVSGWLEQGEV